MGHQNTKYKPLLRWAQVPRILALLKSMAAFPKGFGLQSTIGWFGIVLQRCID